MGDETSGVGTVVVAALLRDEKVGLGGAVGCLKPSPWGVVLARPFSTLVSARSARKLMLFIISSRRDWKGQG